MAYNEFLADRVRQNLSDHKIAFREVKMMGGICFMVNEKMFAGIVKNDLMARIDPEIYPEAMAKKGCREMDFTHRPMQGFVFVDPEGTDLDDDLSYWIQLCLDFNPKAKAGNQKRTGT